METLIKRLERSTFIQAALYVIIGLLIILYPRVFFDAIVYLVAAYFAIIGLVAIVQGLRHKRDGLPPGFFNGNHLYLDRFDRLFLRRNVGEPAPDFYRRPVLVRWHHPLDSSHRISPDHRQSVDVLHAEQPVMDWNRADHVGKPV
ncbi:DUF308 domain-containing protein [Exiguobacterium chiriqhucha]